MREHGTRACYVHGPDPGSRPGGCRCGPCRRASTEAQRRDRARVAPPLVDATEVREHLAMLSAAGVGLKQVTKLTGVSGGHLTKILYGTPRADGARRPPAARVRPETRDRILAVMPSQAADSARTPGAPVWRNVDELLARGWTKAAIARAIGQGGPKLQLGRRFVEASNARAIRALLDEPVPPRRSRHGLHPVPQPVVDEREQARRAAEAERRAMYRRRLAPDGPAPVELGSWVERGACRGDDVPTWMMFPSPNDRRVIAAAKAVCARCPVRGACADYAIAADEGDGVWGGMTPAERARQAVAS